MKKEKILATTIVAVVAIIGAISALTFSDWGLGIYSSTKPSSVSNAQEEIISSGSSVVESANVPPAAQEESPKITESASQTYKGEIIAGSTTPYIRYNKVDFDKARSEGKAIYIYVYATWCPICAAERPSILAAFDELDSPTAVGFETHWIDGQDNNEDHDLQRTFGVAQQHTHIFLKKDGSVAEKIFTPISKDEIKSKILNIA